MDLLKGLDSNGLKVRVALSFGLATGIALSIHEYRRRAESCRLHHIKEAEDMELLRQALQPLQVKHVKEAELQLSESKNVKEAEATKMQVPDLQSMEPNVANDAEVTKVEVPNLKLLEATCAPDADNSESSTQQITFQPGSIGMAVSRSKGIVTTIISFSQADSAGVKVGWKPQLIDDCEFSVQLLSKKYTGTMPYTITFSVDCFDADELKGVLQDCTPLSSQRPSFCLDGRGQDSPGSNGKLVEQQSVSEAAIGS